MGSGKSDTDEPTANGPQKKKHMEYSGKLYGKVGKSYFPLEKSTDDFEWRPLTLTDYPKFGVPVLAHQEGEPKSIGIYRLDRVRIYNSRDGQSHSFDFYDGLFGMDGPQYQLTHYMELPDVKVKPKEREGS